MNDEEYLNSGRGVRATRSPTAAERYRRALGDRDRLQAQVDHLCRQIDHPADFARDPGDMIRRQEIARMALPGVIAELRDAIERTIELRPMAEQSRPQQQRAPQPVVWLDKPARAPDRGLEYWREHFRKQSAGYLTRDMRSR